VVNAAQKLRRAFAPEIGDAHYGILGSVFKLPYEIIGRAVIAEENF
jgi:hypothetical protein